MENAQIEVDGCDKFALSGTVSRAWISSLLILAASASGCLSPLPMNFDRDALGMAELLESSRPRIQLPDATELIDLEVGGQVEQAHSYRVQAGDELGVSIWGRPDLGSQLASESRPNRNSSLVHEDGSIRLPFIRRLPVAGKTIGEITALVEQQYSRVVPSPEAEVEVVVYRSKPVHIIGAVEKPGIYFLSPEANTLADMVAIAGGLREDAKEGTGLLTREGVAYRVAFQAGAVGSSRIFGIEMKAGDTLFFSFPRTDEVVYVMGEVFRQGTFPIPTEGLTVLGAVGNAFGFAPAFAAVRDIMVVRDSEDEPVLYKVTLAELLSSPGVQLNPGDRIFVPPTALTLWERFWKQFLPFFSSGGSAAQVARAVAPL